MNSEGLGCVLGMETTGCEHKPHVDGRRQERLRDRRWAPCEHDPRQIQARRGQDYPALGTHYLAKFLRRIDRHRDLGALQRRLLYPVATALPLPRPIVTSSTVEPSPLPPEDR